MQAWASVPPVSLWAAVFCTVCCLAAAQALVWMRPPKVLQHENRMVCLDGLRGISVLGVFFNHYIIGYYYGMTGQWVSPSTDFYNVFGQAGICFFFMMSGFLFWGKLWAGGGRVDWGRLYLMRFLRLTPMYWVYVALVMLIIFTTGGPLKEPLSKVFLKIGQWLLYFWSPVINGFNNDEPFPVRVQWTLRYEWIFYFSLPFLALAIRAFKKFPFILGLIAAAVILGALNPRVLKGWGLEINTKFFVYFLVGCVPATFNDERIKQIARKKVVSVLALTAFVVYCLSFRSGYDPKAIPLLAAFFIPVAYGNSLFGLLRMRSWVMLGEISYSFYLLHALVLYALFLVWFPAFFSPGTGMFWIEAGMGLSAVLVVLLSWMSFSWIGLPFISLGRRLTGTKPGQA